MNNRNLLVLLCPIFCAGLSLVAQADTPAIISVQPIVPASDNPWLRRTPNLINSPSETETVAWTTLLQNVNEALIEVWSLQQEKSLIAATSDQLRTAQNALESTRNIAQQRLVALQEDATKETQMPGVKWRISQLETAKRSAQAVIYLLQGGQFHISQIEAEPQWATQLDDLGTALGTASGSAQTLLQLFTPSMTDAELRDIHQKNQEEYQRALAWYEQWMKDKPARDTQDAEVARRIQQDKQKQADARKEMTPSQEKWAAQQKRLERLYERIKPMNYL